MLRKSPGFAVVAVLTLALGIGANVAIFTLVNAVLLQPLAFQEPDRLVRVFDDLNGAGAKDVGMSVPELQDLQERSGVFENVSVVVSVSLAFTGGERAERVEMLGTNPNYFEMLRARPALGRVYGQADWAPGFIDGVVISDGLWKRQFGGDPHVIGRRVRLDEDGYTIIGVMPPDFQHPGQTLDGDIGVWAAAGLMADPFPTPPIRGLRMLPAPMGRLKPGLTLAVAQQRLDALVERLSQAYPKEYPVASRWSLRLEPVQTSLTGNVRPTLMVLLAAVSFVLLMVCVNIASLLIARSSARMREMAIRQALGASRSQLVRQLLTESVLLSLIGGAAAIAVLEYGRASLMAMIPPDLPRLAEVRFDWRTIAFTFLVSIATGALFGLTPALQASAIDPNRGLKEGGRTGGGQSVRQNRFRAALVTMEVALSVVLLIGAGLLIRSFSSMLRQNPGLAPKGLTVGQIWIPVPNNPKMNRYFTPSQSAPLVRELLRQVSALPGVQSAAIGLSADVPFLSGQNNFKPFSFAGDSASGQKDYAAKFGAVSPRYFQVLKIPLERGRMFTDLDSAKSKNVVIVNESFVRKFLPNEEPIGKRLVSSGDRRESEIIAVVADVRDEGLDTSQPPHIYSSIFQISPNDLAVFVRTRTDAGAINNALTRTVQGVDPELPVFDVRTMEDLMAASEARRRFTLYLMATFATVALLLAAMGIYGVMAYMVGQRKQEFGIRLALGAQPRDILMLAFRPGLLLTAIGTIAGLAAAIVLTRLMSSLLFGVSATDPLTFAGVPIILAVVAMIACWIPAWRATRILPVETLRC